MSVIRSCERQKVCPQCGSALTRVRRSADSPLNEYQFDAVKAGDWLCPNCPDNDRARNGGCYWWERELPEVIDYQI